MARGNFGKLRACERANFAVVSAARLSSGSSRGSPSRHAPDASAAGGMNDAVVWDCRRKRRSKARTLGAPGRAIECRNAAGCLKPMRFSAEASLDQRLDRASTGCVQPLVVGLVLYSAEILRTICGLFQAESARESDYDPQHALDGAPVRLSGWRAVSTVWWDRWWGRITRSENYSTKSMLIGGGSGTIRQEADKSLSH